MSIFDESNREKSKKKMSYDRERKDLYNKTAAFLKNINKMKKLLDRTSPEEIINKAEEVKSYVNYILKKSIELTEETIMMIRKYSDLILENGVVTDAVQLKVVETELEKTRNALRETVDKINSEGVLRYVLVKKVFGISKILVALIFVVTGHVEGFLTVLDGISDVILC